MTRQQLTERVYARISAKAILSLIQDELAKLGDHGRAAFWDELGVLADRLPSTPVSLPKAKPMSDEEAREFRKETIRFGQFSGRSVQFVEDRTIIDHEEQDTGLGYLRWLADQDFTDQLRRYLARDEFTHE